MQRSPLTAAVAIVLTVFGPTGGLVAQVSQPVQICPTPNGPFTDNRDGYLVQFEEAPLHPIELAADRDEAWVLNLADARVSVFDTTNAASPQGPQLVAEIAVGLGPVTVRRRPPQPGQTEPDEGGPGDGEQDGEPTTDAVREMWVVCQSSNSVFVVDEASRRVRDVIRVEHEPSGLVFDAAGATAYVTLSASNQIAVVDATTRQVTSRIEFQSELPLASGVDVHAEEPTALLVEGDDLFVLSQLSGNGTTFDELDLNTTQTPVEILNLWDVFNGTPGLPAPPDRDVFRFDVNAPAATGTVVGWRFGTLNFDLKRAPDGDLLVSNVDLANDTTAAEFLYKLLPFASHRLSLRAESPSPTGNTSVAHFDLNAAANVHAALQAQGYSCSVPNEMALDADGDTLYVACYGTSNVAVVDYPPTTVLAELRSGASPAAITGFGPRGVALDEARGVVYVHNRGDHTLQTYAAAPAAGSVNAPLSTVRIGYDVTPPNVRAGRFLFNDAKNSTFGTESCGSCHPDGHFDGVAWDLGDFTGDVPTQLGDPLPGQPVARDPKLLKVTMSLRGIEETPPFHWRGDRPDLQDFGPAMVGLLGGGELSPAQLQAIDDYVFSLSYRPNPGQSFDRVYSREAVDGFGCFTLKTAHDVSTDTVGNTVPLSCEDCHSMAGFSATNNQINNDVGPPPSGAPPFGLLAEDATQLRGLFDKESDTVFYGGYGVPATGWGFANPGSVDTVGNFVDLGVFHALTAAERDQIKLFLEEFDSGTAPTTAYAWHLNRASAASPPPAEVGKLFTAANRGHNDLIVRGWMVVGGAPRPIGMLYSRASGNFATDTTVPAPVPPQTLASLTATALAGQGAFTLMGVPVGTGYRLGLDREMDYLLDGDEAFYGTSLLGADSDGDSFPDGYEARLGSDPAAAASTPPSETTPPTILTPQLAWFNSNVFKLRWRTDEESVSRVHVQDLGGTTLQTFEELQPKKQHVLVGRGLKPGESYVLVIESEDPVANQAQLTLPAFTEQPRLFTNAVHVEASSLAVNGTATPGQPVPLLATFRVVDQDGQPLPGRTVTFDYLEWIPGGGAITPASLTTGPANASGDAVATFSSGVLAGQGGVAEVISRNVNDALTNRLLFFPESGQFGFWSQIGLP